jgi:hypothetical protein
MFLIDFQFDADVDVVWKTAAKISGETIGLAGVWIVSTYPQVTRIGFQICLPVAA